MRACSWMLVAVLAVGMGLQSSGGAAESPEGSAPAEAIAFVLGGSRCPAPAPALGEPVQPMFLSCSAHITCLDGATLSCSLPSGTCTGVEPSCPGENGYVQCGSYVVGCSTPCPEPPGTDCTLYCSVNSDCTSHCGGPGVCSTGCNPNKPNIKMCFCTA